MLGFGKKYSDTPWKTEDGTFKCQSEICPPDMCGSGKCPLDLQTNAFSLMSNGNYKGAIVLLTKAVAIEMNCAQLWANLGACFGNIGDHRRARDAFRTSLSIDPDKETAQQGLAIAEMHLCGGIEGVSSIRSMDVFEKLLDFAVHNGDMREKISKSVPELMGYADGLSDAILDMIYEDDKKRGINQSPSRVYETVLLWSIFAGFGGVLEWHYNWSLLEKTGLLEKLTAERGIYAMDEYVTQLYTGEKYDTDAGIIPKSCDEFSKKLQSYSYLAELILGDSLAKLEDHEDAEKFANANLPELSKGCYMFGMAFALEKRMR